MGAAVGTAVGSIKGVTMSPETGIMEPVPERLLLVSLNTLPIIGPRKMTAAMTTTAIRTIANAYSTNPCAFAGFEEDGNIIE
jgi:hypothetical protein